MVDRVFVTERDSEHPLDQNYLYGALDRGRGETVDKAVGAPVHQTSRALGRAERQHAGVRGVVAAARTVSRGA